MVVTPAVRNLIREAKIHQIYSTMQAGGKFVVSLHENIDTTSTTGKLFFHIFGALAEFERNLIRERTQAGLAAAKARGRKGGRRRVLSDEKIVLLDLLLGKSEDFRSHAKVLGVSETDGSAVRGEGVLNGRPLYPRPRILWETITLYRAAD